MKHETLPYEEAAEQRTVTGWCCKTCQRFYGNDESCARFCCAKDRPCECGLRTERHWTKCKDCRAKEERECWEAAPLAEWDGEYPLCIWDSDRYFWDEDNLAYYMDDNEVNSVLDLQLQTCEQHTPRFFEMNEFLSDDLPEDDSVDAAEIDKTVNDWIAANVSKLWYGSGKRVGEASLRANMSPDMFDRAATK